VDRPRDICCVFTNSLYFSKEKLLFNSQLIRSICGGTKAVDQWIPRNEETTDQEIFERSKGCWPRNVEFFVSFSLNPFIFYRARCFETTVTPSRKSKGSNGWTNKYRVKRDQTKKVVDVKCERIQKEKERYGKEPMNISPEMWSWVGAKREISL
jgi:hypothetical protein